jgi:acylphosphatase
VEGDVQGVGYRLECRREARGRGLRGWVSNLPDGRVEAVFEGPEQDVRALVEWCHRGPSAARVERVGVEWESPTGEEPEFEVAGSGSVARRALRSGARWLGGD